VASASPPGGRDIERRPTLAARLLGGGYRGARAVAGATGIDQAVETAAEEAIVQALESPAVERALARVLQGPIVTEAAADALASPQVEAALVEALDSELVDRIWDRLLASDEVQRLVERIAEAPEVRSAITSQGVGFLDDIRRQIRKVTRRLDDVVERIARAVLRRERRAVPTDRAGAVTRVLAFALDGAILNGLFLALSAVVTYLANNVFGHHGSVSGQAIVAGIGLWLVAGSVYLTLFWGLTGQTPGMRFFGIRLLPPEDRGIGARRAVRRLVGLVLAIIPLGLGLLGILVGDRRRGFHDRYAETEVAFVPERAAPWAAATGGDRVTPANAVTDDR
jgi:uncharacterized RDD family membrane protein YckC